MDSHAFHAKLVLLPLMEISNVLELQLALVTTNILEISTTAMPVELVKMVKYQLKTEEDALDKDQHVDVLNSTLKMDINAFLAKMVMLPMQELYNVSQLQHVLVTTNILVISTTAMPVELVNFHKFQLKTEEDALDKDQHVDVLNSTLQMDINAFLAKMDLLLTQEIYNV
jgi:GTP cyclohydrolase III